MRNLWPYILKLAGWQKLALGLLILLILATWLAVCLILSTYLGS